MANIQESFPTQTTGLGVATQIIVEGNERTKTTPGYNNVHISLSGANGPTTFQLNPQVADVSGAPVAIGTVFTLTAVAAPAPGPLTLTSVAASVNGQAVYTGTITGGAANALVGQLFTVAGFDDAVNNGSFVSVASTATALTLVNANAIADTHAATATSETGTAVYTGTITGAGTALTLTAVAGSIAGEAVYTGTITGGAANALAGTTFSVTGFVNTGNNGVFIATASTATTLTLENLAAIAETHAGTATETLVGNTVAIAGFVNASNNGSFIVLADSATTLTVENDFTVAETHAATATLEESTNLLTYVAWPSRTLTGNTFQPLGTSTAVATVSNTGLITAVAVGHVEVEVSFPFAQNASGTTGAKPSALNEPYNAFPNNPNAGLPINKIYTSVNVRVDL
jgi:hypothetical protein